MSGKTGKFIKISFKGTQEMMEVKNELIDQVTKNKKERGDKEAYEGWYNQNGESGKENAAQFKERIIEIREYDVAYHIRAMIDNEIRCAFWYEVGLEGPILKKMTHLTEKLDKADLRIMAFDIETTKQKLKFPDAKFD